MSFSCPSRFRKQCGVRSRTRPIRTEYRICTWYLYCAVWIIILCRFEYGDWNCQNAFSFFFFSFFFTFNGGRPDRISGDEWIRQNAPRPDYLKSRTCLSPDYAHRTGVTHNTARRSCLLYCNRYLPAHIYLRELIKLILWLYNYIPIIINNGDFYASDINAIYSRGLA